MSKSKNRYVGILALLVLLAVGCQSSTTAIGSGTQVITTPISSGEEISSPQSREEDIVTLRFACYDTHYPVFEELAVQFHQMNPDIRIELVPMEDILPSSLSDYTQILYETVTHADTAYWVGVTRKGTRQGLVYDLTAFIEADPDFDREDFYPQMLETVRWDGGTWGIPAHGFLQMLFYDKRAFDEAGIPYPEVGWDRDDFLEIAQLVTMREQDQVTRYGFATFDERTSYRFIEGMANPYLVDAAGIDYPNLNSPDVVDALKWYTDLALVHDVMPPQGAIAPTVIRDGRPTSVKPEWFQDRRVAMWPDFVSNFSSYAIPRYGFGSEDVGLATYPFGEQTAAFLDTTGFLMSAGTEHPQQSWQWLKFLSHQPLGSITNIPARRSVAESQAYWARWDETNREIVELALDHTHTLPAQDAISQALFDVVEAVLAGETAEAALEVAQANAQEAYTAPLQTAPLEVVIVPSDDEQRSGDIVVHFAPLLYDPSGTYRSLAEAFNAEYTGVQVEVVNAGSNAVVDCFTGTDNVVHKGVADHDMQPLNLQPLVDTDVNLSLDAYYFVDIFRRDGNLYGLPVLAQPEVLLYNQELFDAAGISYPVSGWTLEEFRQAAKMLTRGEGTAQQYGFVPLNGAGIDAPLFLSLYGTQLWDAQGRPRFDAPDVIEAVRWYIGLIEETMPPSSSVAPTDVTLAQRQDLLEEERGAMWSMLLAGLWQDGTRDADTQIAMAPFPGDVTRVSYEGLFINASASRAEAAACWEWLKYASANRPADPARGIPAYKASLESPIFTTRAGPGVVETFQALVADGGNIHDFREGTQAQFEILCDALDQILDGAPLESTLVEAQQQANK